MTDDSQEQSAKLARLCAMLDQIEPPTPARKYHRRRACLWIWHYRWMQARQKVRRIYWALGRLIS